MSRPRRRAAGDTIAPMVHTGDSANIAIYRERSDAAVGPLRFACDTFESRCYGDLESWAANVRAIALGMEALRKVDRHGMTNRREQYTGWLALEAGPTVMTVEQARVLLDSYGGPREAVRAAHPDRGGDPEEFRRVQEARRIVKEAAA